MHKADRFLKKLLNFVNKNPNYTVWICSSMGQAATETNSVDTILYLTNPTNFMKALAMPDSSWEHKPAMVPQCNFKIALEKRDYFNEQLRSILIGDTPLAFSEREPGFFKLELGHKDGANHINHILYRDQKLTLAEAGFEHLKVEDNVGVTAYHVPEGCLVIYNPEESSRKAQHRPHISTLDIAPAVLANFNIPIPDYMKTAQNILINAGDR